MSYKTDAGGLALACNDLKLHDGASTWSTRLSQLSKVKGEILIETYSLPNLEYIARIFDKRPFDIIIIANSKFKDRAKLISDKYPGIEVRLLPDMHRKTLIIEPNTVYIGSANFGNSGWKECCIGMHSAEAFQFYREQFYRDWQEAGDCHKQ